MSETVTDRTSDGGALKKLVAIRNRISSWAEIPRVRRVLLLVGLAAFIIMAVASWMALPTRPTEVSWPLLAVVLFGLAPLTTALSAAEYHRTVRIVGHQISSFDSLQIAVASSAANLLPLPGSFLVRATALRKAGASTWSSVAAPVGVGLSWLAVGCVLAGTWLSISSPSSFAFITLGVGIALIVASVQALRSSNTAIGGQDVAAIWAIEGAMVAVSAVRYLLVLLAIGYEVSMGQTLALALSNIFATATGVMPAGVGIREAIAGAIAPLVALSAAVGVLSAVINRILELIALALMSGGLAVVDANRGRAG